MTLDLFLYLVAALSFLAAALGLSGRLVAVGLLALTLTLIL